ncbi:hypothetical protein CHS0354_007306, partial [Potamilus streckersoni]
MRRVATNAISEFHRHVFVAFQLAARRTYQTENKHTFENIRLSRIHVRINYRQYSGRELECIVVI